MGHERSCAMSISTVVSWPWASWEQQAEVADDELLPPIRCSSPCGQREPRKLLQTLSGRCCLPAQSAHTPCAGQANPRCPWVSGPYTSQVEFPSLKTGNQLL